MKKLLAVCIVLLSINTVCAEVSESQKPDLNLLKYTKLDFEVPDSPAFNLVTTDESKILRPATAKELTASFSGIDKKTKEVAIELSPFLLVNENHLTLSAYQKRPWLYRTRISAAVKRGDENMPTQVSAGIRVALIDGSDLRTNAEYLNQATTLSAKINDVYTTCVTRGPKGVRVNPLNRPSIPGYTQDERDKIKAIEKDLNTFREDLQEKLWNASILEMAFGTRVGSFTPTNDKFRCEAHSAWLTWGIPIKNWGQWLIGGNGSSTRSMSDSLDSQGSISTRLYLGMNDFKCLLEVQDTVQQNVKPVVFYNGGVQAKIRKGLWVEATGGFKQDFGSDTAKFVTVAKIKADILRIAE